ncbi:MAG: CidA/LrgA family protein [Alicyclobacillus sp.]|nr:CidA/LrgA family protein [Alicyclobacillus sp.]
MGSMLRAKGADLARVVVQVAVLFGLADIGGLISRFAHLPIPGSILGLIGLFLLLKLGVVKLEWVAAGGDWLVREMLLFFVPSAVGVLSYAHLLMHQGLQMVATVAISTALVMWLTGAVADGIWKAKKHRGAGAKTGSGGASTC